MSRRYIYGEQFAQKLPGSNQNFYFRTITGYEVDNNGKPIEGTAKTDLYYAPKPGQANSRGVVWTPGNTDSIDNFNPGGYVRAGSTSDNGKSYAFLFYTQEDADLGRIPPGKKVGDVVLGATAQQSLTTSGGRFYEAVQNNLINLAANTQPGLAQVVSAKQKNAVAQQQVSGDPNKPDPQDTTVDISKISQINPDGPNPPFSKAFGREDLVYPTKIRDNGQDFIKFTVAKYVTRKLDVSGAIGILNQRGQLTDILGTIILPIQPAISDSNNVDWNGIGINPLEMELTTAGLNLMSGSGKQYVDNLIGKLESAGKDKNIINSVKLYFAQKAAGVNGLLSRVSGAVVNPNLELLFQGPTLRPFTFTFRLSPRDSTEAKTVRQIIRAFKQYSAVGTASNNLFLTTPNVFNIQYVSKRNGKEENHKSLNRIKTCALKSVSVDYTPDGSYMTFNDEARTLTSYSLSLQFQELEPVTTKDYDMSYDEIGY